MTSFAVRVLACTLLLLATTFVTAPARAAGLPVIVSPVEDATYPHGWAGPIEVDFTGATHGVYDIRVGCQEYAWADTYTYNGSTPEYSAALFPIADSFPTACGMDVRHRDTGDVVALTFSVEGPEPLTFSGVAVAPGVFYPLLRDGYRDQTRLRFDAPVAGSATVMVVDAAGRRVRAKRLPYTAQGDAFSWSWAGRTESGSWAPPGVYRFFVEFDGDMGRRGTFERTVRVATGWRSSRVTKSRAGIESTAVFRTPGCSVTPVAAEAALRLACRGGQHALARYAFHVPAGATDLAHGMSGSPGCCAGGTLTRTAGRTSPDQYRVTAKVTGQRSIKLLAVWVSYTVRQRI